jgi:hypothetical protein
MDASLETKDLILVGVDTRPINASPTDARRSDFSDTQKANDHFLDSSINPIDGNASPDTGFARDTAPVKYGAKFPFPQNRTLERCVFPKNYRNDDVQKAYDK